METEWSLFYIWERIKSSVISGWTQRTQSFKRRSTSVLNLSVIVWLAGEVLVRWGLKIMSINFTRHSFIICWIGVQLRTLWLWFRMIRLVTNLRCLLIVGQNLSHKVCWHFPHVQISCNYRVIAIQYIEFFRNQYDILNSVSVQNITYGL